MTSVPRAPFAIAAAVVLGTAGWSLALAADGGPFAASSAAVIAGGLMIYAVIAAGGMLLARGGWSRRLAGVVTTCGLALTVPLGLHGWAWPGLVLSAAALTGLSGPWLGGWLRRLPSADGPGIEPMALALGSLGLLPAVGLVSPAGLEPAHGALAGAGILLAWAYSRARLWALWGLRLALVPLGVVAAVASPPAGGVALVSATSALSWLAWRKPARLAIDPFPSRLPAPRRPPRDRATTPGSDGGGAS